MSEIPLSLNPQNNSDPNRNFQKKPDQPVMGWFAVGFGLLGIFTIGPVFVPLGFICSVLALFFGQILWGFIGLLLAIMGLITSPILIAALSLLSVYQMLDLNEILKPFYDLIGVEPPPGRDI